MLFWWVNSDRIWNCLNCNAPIAIANLQLTHPTYLYISMGQIVYFDKKLVKALSHIWLCIESCLDISPYYVCIHALTALATLIILLPLLTEFLLTVWQTIHVILGNPWQFWQLYKMSCISRKCLLWNSVDNPIVTQLYLIWWLRTFSIVFFRPPRPHRGCLGPLLPVKSGLWPFLSNNIVVLAASSWSALIACSIPSI